MTAEGHKNAENSLSDPFNANCRTRPAPPPTPMSGSPSSPAFDLAYSDRRLECQNLTVAFEMGLYSDWRWHAALRRYLNAPLHNPRRIQRSGREGWRMPPNTVFVGAPSMWANPFPVGEASYHVAVGQFRFWLENSEEGLVVRRQIYRLRGKNLCCWCPLDQPCHADVLLELANRPFKETTQKGVRSMIRNRRPKCQVTRQTAPCSMATKTNEGTDERYAMDGEMARRCLLSAHTIAVEADRLKFCFTLQSVDAPLTRTINIALEIIDKQMGYLSDVMSTIPTEGEDVLG